MDVVGELIKKGLDISKTSALIYERMTFANRKLLGRAMDRLFAGIDGKLAISAITWNDLTEFEGEHRDTDFIVDEVRKLGGPEVYILAKEFRPDQFRISMRGRGRIDLNKIAQGFGGGGHHDAAGFTVTGDWLYVRGALLELFEPLLE
jgi:phosphoesterase RecJ-like protein